MGLLLAWFPMETCLPGCAVSVCLLTTLKTKVLNSLGFVHTGGCLDGRNPGAVGAQQCSWAAEGLPQKGSSREIQIVQGSPGGTDRAAGHVEPAVPGGTALLLTQLCPLHMSQRWASLLLLLLLCAEEQFKQFSCYVLAKPPCLGAFLTTPIGFSLLHLPSAHSAQAGIAFALGKSLLQCSLAAAECRACLGRGGMSEMGCTLKWGPVALFSDNVDFVERSSTQSQGLEELPRCRTGMFNC